MQMQNVKVKVKVGWVKGLNPGAMKRVAGRPNGGEKELGKRDQIRAFSIRISYAEDVADHFPMTSVKRKSGRCTIR